VEWVDVVRGFVTNVGSKLEPAPGTDELRSVMVLRDELIYVPGSHLRKQPHR